MIRGSGEVLDVKCSFQGPTQSECSVMSAVIMFLKSPRVWWWIAEIGIGEPSSLPDILEDSE